MKCNEILVGNALDVIKTLDDNSISVVVTSPPYWNLRDYHTEPQIWDGDSSCQHTWQEFGMKGKHGGKSAKLAVKGVENFQDVEDTTHKVCTKCNAWYGELGREPYADMFIKHLCDIFDAIRPKLTDWGSLYVNLGDSRYGSGGSGSQNKRLLDKIYNPQMEGGIDKSLAAIPFLFVIEMMKRGWIYRNDIIWHKKNPMPYSAADNFTPDHEYIFFFVKNKQYYFRQWLEPAENQTILSASKYGGTKFSEGNVQNGTFSGKEYEPYYDQNGIVMRNKRTTWSLTTSRFKGNHFAVYPKQLVEIPIFCSCPEKVCTKCGQPVKWTRIKESIATRNPSENIKGQEGIYATAPERRVSIDRGLMEERCECNAEFKPGIVLDPFFGSGTTGIMALEQGKYFIGIDIKPENKKLAEENITSYFEDFRKVEDDLHEV